VVHLPHRAGLDAAGRPAADVRLTRLIPGARPGPYEILALVGSGGKGEVYRARDTRLDRRVAIKVAPMTLAALRPLSSSTGPGNWNRIDAVLKTDE
jgi:serine/threonine protein kinase